KGSLADDVVALRMHVIVFDISQEIVDLLVGFSWDHYADVFMRRYRMRFKAMHYGFVTDLGIRLTLVPTCCQHMHAVATSMHRSGQPVAKHRRTVHVWRIGVSSNDDGQRFFLGHGHPSAFTRVVVLIGILNLQFIWIQA